MAIWGGVMPLSKFCHVNISGISVVVPEKEISIYDEAQYYNNNIKKIDRMRKMVGFHKRRVADKSSTALDFAYNAAKNLIEETKIDVSTIDALIFIVQKPDWIGPSNSYFLHHKLKLSKDAIATDITQGCAGWVFGLYMASQMIESGAHKKILLLNGDTPSIGIQPSNRNQAPVFGDGGCATLLEYSENKLLSYYNIDTISEGYEAIISPFSGFKFKCNILDDDSFEKLKTLRQEKITLPTGNVQPLLSSHLDGISVFDFTINVVPKTIGTLLSYAGQTPADIDVLALHQANKQIVQSVGAKCGFDLEKLPYEAFENYGNNTMCSIPTTLALLDNATEGGKNKEKVLCCGFGNGLVAAAALLNLKSTYIGKIKTFVKPEYVMSQDEYINYWRNKMQGK